jgi:hypothetical protein
MSDAGVQEGHGFPWLVIIRAQLLGSGSRGAILKAAAESFAASRVGGKAQIGIFPDTPDTSGMGRNVFENRGIGIAAVESQY